MRYRGQLKISGAIGRIRPVPHEAPWNFLRPDEFPLSRVHRNQLKALRVLDFFAMAAFTVEFSVTRTNGRTDRV